MKKWAFLLVIVFLLFGFEVMKQEPEVASNKLSIEDYLAQDKIDQDNNHSIEVGMDRIYQGDLLLVNNQYPVHPAGVTPDVVNLFQNKELVRGYGLLDNTIQLSRRVVQQFKVMIDKAARDGVRHFLISSGYRDEEDQNRLYKEMGSDYALPAGYSEHNVGLSLDIGSTEMAMNQADEGQWLQKHASTYGFILRYPKDKSDITGIQYEPWHYRYVGLPHSMIMQEKNFTLEQYLDFLKEQKTYTTSIDHKEYEISYYPIVNNTMILMPTDRRYEVSGNNIDGVIVTLYP
ncbi:M15 family metallopeptidase [Paenibacillus macquariensis]|uniref:D-alanyl-D-alanine carboxypeptidase n=1 Tax=Paenibacillus macquariensis TaxID=948756 RepID=A0ABY1KAS2_9BACL|nr:M15 family metallopeptidase [Paenibacillus macquariensis]MEC0089473.1 M15 family metallopeptidase [Paenibacillus macquariensis]OAB25849.1 D-Ala-D-Ala carboxypeptidase VanY [Paenibacillus macquariensis subsp. macquariensis]SIR52484.1 D-alanyl-D-alanine carboxypeptidase [Paenibacillus macquariensis]